LSDIFRVNKIKEEEFGGARSKHGTDLKGRLKLRRQDNIKSNLK
jgi:hypothetical protein